MLGSFWKKFQFNWKSGLTVGLVSLPLSISLAVAANGTPVMGVITAAWSGLIASFFGGSNYNIVGPTGALSGILAAYAITHGVESLPVLAIFSGFLILLCYIFHLQKYIVFIPSSVIHGFTLGVAFIIAFNQFNFAFGLTGLPAHEQFISNVIESLQNIGSIDIANSIIFGLSLILLFVFLRYFKKIPGPIIVALIGIFIGYMGVNHYIPLKLLTLQDKFGEIPSIIIQQVSFSTKFINSDLLKTGVTIALIAILETLISGKIADGMTKTKFNSRKEILGLGLANIASGLAGGIPATAALARTALNVKTGATYKTSAGMSSLTVAIISLIFLPYFKYLPLSIVAAILVYVAIRMIEAEHFKHLYHYDKKAFWLSMLVGVITIVSDPMVGILAGATIALLMFVKKLSTAQSEITINKNQKIVARTTGQTMELQKDHDLLVYRFNGQLTYINAQSHLETIRKIKDIKTVILAFRNLFYIDLDGLDAMEEIIDILEAHNGKVLITGIGPNIEAMIRKTHWYQNKENQQQVYPGTSDALKAIGYTLYKY